MASNTEIRSVSITLAAPFPSSDRIRAPCCFSVQFPTANPVEVPPAPSAVRCGGAPDARSSTRTLPKVNPCAGVKSRFYLMGSILTFRIDSQLSKGLKPWHQMTWNATGLVCNAFILLVYGQFLH